MRTARLLALVVVALSAPLARSAAQTCEGMAAFQDGRWRAGVDDQASGEFNGVRGTLEFGLPQSIYGGISVGGLHVVRPGSSSADIGVNLGYQIPISNTPFQFCPSASGHYSLGAEYQTIQEAFGGGLGYLLRVSDWFTVVPAAGVWVISTRSTLVSNVINVVDPAPGPSTGTSTADDGASNQMFLTMGLVLRGTLTINPGVIFSSQNGVRPIYTLGVSINWAK